MTALSPVCRPYSPLAATAALPHPRATVRPISGVAWCVTIWAAPGIIHPAPDALTVITSHAAAMTWASRHTETARAAAAAAARTEHSRGGEYA